MAGREWREIRLETGELHQVEPVVYEQIEFFSDCDAELLGALKHVFCIPQLGLSLTIGQNTLKS